MIVITIVTLLVVVLLSVVAPLLLLISIPMWIFGVDIMTRDYFKQSRTRTRILVRVAGVASSVTVLSLLWTFGITNQWTYILLMLGVGL
ncbi:hypothetical protein DBR17_03065 [Sphingomonas sp. HMWF008]|nr:hypothetical protein DBR17_03065 [Sphingomonas sp. HMWF008]